MTVPTLVIGVDPGMTTGVAAFGIGFGTAITRPRALQCSHDWALELVERELAEAELQDLPRVLAVERFVIRARAARSATPVAGEITRKLIGDIQTLGERHGARTVLHSAADVKPWGTDRRLDAAGLLAPCVGMGHARDAARHALFSAVQTAGLPDPLTLRTRAPR